MSPGMNIREIFATLRLRDDASNKIRKVNREMDQSARKFGKATRATRELRRQQDKTAESGLSMGKIFKYAAAWYAGSAVIGGIKRFGKAALGAAANMESIEVSMATIIGDADKAKSLIEKLKEFSLVTPFTPVEIIETSKLLLGMQLPLDKQLETLRMLGDVASGAAVPIGDLAAIYGKAFNKGKVETEQLNQMAERGIPILKALADLTGEDTAAIYKMASTGEISFEMIEEAFANMTSAGGIYHKMMQKQSRITLGLWSTLAGYGEEVMIAFGDKMLPIAKDLMKLMIGYSQEFLKWVKVPENAAKITQAFKDLGVVLTKGVEMLRELVELINKLEGWRQKGKPITSPALEFLRGVGMPGIPGFMSQEARSTIAAQIPMLTPGLPGAQAAAAVYNLKFGDIRLMAATGKEAAKEFMAALNGIAPMLKAQAVP